MNLRENRFPRKLIGFKCLPENGGLYSPSTLSPLPQRLLASHFPNKASHPCGPKPPAPGCHDLRGRCLFLSRRIPNTVSGANGKRVKSVMDGETILFAGAHYEMNVNSGAISKYYFAGASRIAMRKYTIPVSMSIEYMLGDHLGSTSMTTDATGVKISEMRYKAWGETRYTWTNAPANPSPVYAMTRYQYTGQFSYESEFGLYFYNARWYDSQLGRFAQADSIVPGGVQGLDRYAYVNNSPMNFTDPSGHDVCDEDGNCYSSQSGWYLQPNAEKWNYSKLIRYGYSDWESQILLKLYEKGGQHARHGVNYIVSHNIHIMVGHLPLGMDKGRGAWFSESANTIVLNEDSYSTDILPSAYGLSLVIHEARHMEQGTELSHSKLGEMDAWQIQFDVLSHFQPLTPAQQDVLNAQTLDEFTGEVQDHWSGYWFNGTLGLYTYPDYPAWCWGGCDYGLPWYLRVNFPWDFQIFHQFRRIK